MPLTKDLLHPLSRKGEEETWLVQSPNPYFADVKCPRCYKITSLEPCTTGVLCVGCSTLLCQPAGGKAKLPEGCSFKQKQH
ncbi:PREDICTED: 40S ribosomal protein S27-like [Elephantulus edwardii]|uniref:40S ribosomal protein S27-like n=1 Tax=Elephantulus edwardii TaxID=28737 RepID=UPI0003F0C845|nr:PREDICTED: 40S ribosomal protein S27-like [Elephantulus edwardii]